MKKLIVKIIRKILLLILKTISFPKTKIETNELLRIEKEYKKKKLSIANNNFKYLDKMDLNFIVPVYNTEKLLKSCADSLIHQKTKYKYNIIFINDGSTDKSYDILLEYKRKYPEKIVIINQENKGISAARNAGLKKVNGKYISFVDSDDFITDNFVETILDSAYKNSADIVRANYYEYDIDKKRIIKKGKNMKNKTYAHGLGKDILNFKGYPWGGVFKSELWQNIEFPEDYWYEDMVIRMIVFRKAKIFNYINDKLYYYCLHTNNISKKIEKTKNIKCLDHFFLINQLYQLSKKMKIKEDEALTASMLYEYSVVLWLRTRKINSKLRKALFSEACKIINSLEIKIKDTPEEKIMTNIFEKYDYISWHVYAIYKMLGVKFGVY